jgi:hypothetical protein
MLRRTLSLSLTIVAIAALTVALAAPSAASPAASSSEAAAASAKKKPRKKHARNRLGGKVRRAWPAPGAKGRPKTPLTRWLARQVGPKKVVPCKKRPPSARRRCAGDAGASTAAGAATVATAAVNRPTEQVAVGKPTGDKRLQLIRSFDIPVDDPSYARLLNWSWTYDSALAATAFSSVGLSAQSARLLDQLAALQRESGAIEFAFDVRTGESSRQIRAGSVAFAGIGFTNYDQAFGDKRYLDNARLVAKYLLSLRNAEGLVRGGPDVKWVSTQHNLLSVIFLTIFSDTLQQHGDQEAADAYRAAAEEIAKSIETHLVVRDGGLLHFRQGFNDETLPLDAQALGVLYSFIRGNEDLGRQVYAYAQSNFQVSGRSVELSKNPATYNMTYEAKGPFSGYRPYLDKKAPDVLWFEGTAQMRFIMSAIGDSTEELDKSTDAWWAITRKQGLAPLGADRTVTGNPFNEYHVWPTAAAGGWTVLSGAADGTTWAESLEK